MRHDPKDDPLGRPGCKSSNALRTPPQILNLFGLPSRKHVYMLFYLKYVPIFPQKGSKVESRLMT